MWGDQAMEIHWLSIVNSFVLVLLLTAFLAVILMRVLRNDFARYMEADAEEMGMREPSPQSVHAIIIIIIILATGVDVDDSGWKQVHGDVFRFPENPMLFSSLIGTGCQLLMLFLSLLTLAVIGTFYHGSRGTMYSAAIFTYALTAGIAGKCTLNTHIHIHTDSFSHFWMLLNRVCFG